MTVKERLRDLIEAASEKEAEQILGHCESVIQNGGTHQNGVKNEQPTDTASFFALLREIAENVPEEDRKRLPTDLAENHDHYIYGTPKRNPVA